MEATQAETPCNQQTFGFQALGARKVEADFSGGYLSSDGGALLLREVEARRGFISRLARCFTDSRLAPLVEHPLEQLLAQRIHGIALGYEDLNDHDRLRLDPLLALTCGREDLLGEERFRGEDGGKSLAGKSTLNRLELGATVQDRTRKIEPDAALLQEFLLGEGVRRIPRKSRAIVVDFDATDDPLHGSQEGRFYHGYYGCYCYLPLYAFCGDIPLWAELRESGIDGAEGALEALQAIVKEIRKRLGKKVAIVMRADSGFCRDELLAWIESQPNVHYIVGLAKNARLEALLAPTYAAVLEEGWGRDLYQNHKEAVSDAHRRRARKVRGEKIEIPTLPEELDLRRYAELRYRTLESWSRERRVVGKAAVTRGKINSRFIVTDLAGEEAWIGGDAAYLDARGLYEDAYCARGDMENRIKEQQLDMFADRTSTGKMSSNQLRLYFSTFAYMLVRDLRADALAGTRFEKSSVGQIRLHLFKIAAQLTVSVRRVYVRLASASPSAADFAKAHANLALST